MNKVLYILIICATVCVACSNADAGSKSIEPSATMSTSDNIHHVTLTMPVYEFKSFALRDCFSDWVSAEVPVVISCNDTPANYNFTITTLHYDYHGHDCDTLDRSMAGVCYLGKVLCYIQGDKTLEALFSATGKSATIKFNTGGDYCKCMEDIKYVLVNGNVAKLVESPQSKRPTETSIALKTADQMPEFPGGDEALKKYIQSHIIRINGDDCTTGRVIVQFVVKKDGSIGEVKVVRSLGKDLDKEAVRVIKSLPRFTPGRNGGESVDVWYTIPVSFKPH